MAKAFKLLKSKQGLELPEPCPEPPRVYSHWDYVRFEAQWMARDVAQETLWKRKAAFVIANTIASSTIRLRPVHKGVKEEDGLSRRSSSRSSKGGGSAKHKSRASKGKRAVSLKSEGDEENEDVTKDGEDMTRRTSQDGCVARPAPPPDIVLSYNFKPGWPQSVKDAIQQKNDEITVAKLLKLHEYETELESNRVAVEDYWREHHQKRAAEHMAARADFDGDDPADARARTRMRKAHTYLDAYDPANDVGASGMTSTSQLDDHGDYRETSSRRPSGRFNKRMRDDDKTFVPRIKNSRHPAALPTRQPLGNNNACENEDDRLLCSIMSEFGENSALVADVYVSTRRLEGIHCDAAHAESRIRQMVAGRQDAGSLAMDFPMPKQEAREFLQQSIPCMASVVMRYQNAVQPIADQVVRERDAEEKNAGQKRAEYMLHNHIPKHQSHNRFLQEATAAYGGVASPKAMLEVLRGGTPHRQPATVAYAAPQVGAPGNVQPAQANQLAANAAYAAMQQDGSHGQPAGLTPQQLQMYQAQHQAQQKQLAAQYATQNTTGGMNNGQGPAGAGLPMPGLPGGNGSVPHMSRPQGHQASMPQQYQQMARPGMHPQRPPGSAPMSGYQMQGMQQGMRPMQPQAMNSQPVGNQAASAYMMGAMSQGHGGQVGMQHMQDALGAGHQVARMPPNTGLPTSMQMNSGQPGGTRSGGHMPGPSNQPHNLPPAPS